MFWNMYEVTCSGISASTCIASEVLALIVSAAKSLQSLKCKKRFREKFIWRANFRRLIKPDIRVIRFHGFIKSRKSHFRNILVLLILKRQNLGFQLSTIASFLHQFSITGRAQTGQYLSSPWHHQATKVDHPSPVLPFHRNQHFPLRR